MKERMTGRGGGGGGGTHLCKLYKLSNFTLTLVPEQHNYATRIASLQTLNPSPFRNLNIGKFFPTIIGCYYWNDIPISICQKPRKQLFKRALFQHYFAQY